MVNINRDKVLEELSLPCSRCTALIADALNDGMSGTSAELVPTAQAFIRFINLRRSAMLDLARLNHLWDAQIVARSVLEALTKFLFIAWAEPPERVKRISEYWNDLADLNSLKQSEAARGMIDWGGGNPALRTPYMPMVLEPNVERHLRESWPKRKRKMLEQKWSYAEMSAWLRAQMKEETPEALSPLSWDYRMSSHLLHADESGIGIVLEREGRSPRDIEIVETAHFGKLASDSVMFLFIGAWGGVLKPFGKDRQELWEIYRDVSPVLDRLQEAAAPLWTGEFYEKAEERFNANFGAPIKDPSRTD